MSETIVDDLEWSRSRNKRASIRPPRRAFSSATPQGIPEDGAVRQSGQGIVVGQILDPRFRLFSRRDVLRDRDEVGDLALEAAKGRDDLFDDIGVAVPMRLFEFTAPDLDSRGLCFRASRNHFPGPPSVRNEGGRPATSSME